MGASAGGGGIDVQSYLIVAALAGLVGVAEILSRYRDVPLLVLKEWPAWTYIAANAFAGVLALLTIDILGWPVDGLSHNGVQRSIEIAIAAFGALAVMRTALIQVRVNDRDVNVGPRWFLNVLLEFTANKMSRKRASHLNKIVAKIMADVNFDKAKEQLPSYCFSLMKTPEDVQRAVSREITSLDVPTMGNSTKVLMLGLVLLELVGEDVLSAAVATLGDEIRLESHPDRTSAKSAGT